MKKFNRYPSIGNGLVCPKCSYNSFNLKYRTGKPPTETTRSDILEAARQNFAEGEYLEVTCRECDFKQYMYPNDYVEQ